MIAHEMGHAHYSRNGRAGKLGKWAHKAYLGGSTGGVIYPGISGIGVGVASGISKAERESEGKKENKVMKHLHHATVAATSAPMLTSEAAASLKGLRLMKKAGADKKILKRARKDLTTAFGSYATAAAMNAGVGEVAKNIAYKKRRRKLENKKKSGTESKESK